MPKVNLTDRAVQTAKTKNGRRTYVWDAKVTEFGMRTEASGRKTFVAKYRFKGEQRMVTLDKYPSSTLADARAKAQAIIGRAHNGEDPDQTDLLPTKNGSFPFILDSYFKKHCAAAKVSRERVLSDQELSIIWQEAQKTPYPFGAIVRLLILTGQRRGEVTKMS